MYFIDRVYADTAVADEFIGKILDSVVNPIIQLLFAVAVLYFLWGVFKFVKGAAEPTAREEGQQHMLWGIIGIVIMVSAYGLISLIQNTLAPIGA